MVTVLLGCLFAYFFHAEDHGIKIVSAKFFFLLFILS
jgi:hypothetical protein